MKVLDQLKTNQKVLSVLEEYELSFDEITVMEFNGIGWKRL